MPGFSSFDFHSKEKNFSCSSLHSGSKNGFFLFPSAKRSSVDQNQLFQFSQITFVARAQNQEGDERMYGGPNPWSGRSPEQQNNSEKEKKESFSFFSDKKRQNFYKAPRQKSSIPSQKMKSGFSNSSFGTNRLSETQKQQVVSITYEEIGLFPRSFNRVFDRCCAR